MNSPPFISLVIPTYRRPTQLAACLESLTELNYPATRWELLVVDDGSPEPLDTVVAPYRERLPLTLLRQENRGPAAARNTGAAQAEGSYIAFTDDDCAPAADWLSRFADAWEETPEQALGGRTVNILKENPYSSASQALIDYLYSYLNRPGPGGAQFLASNNLAFPADGFRKLGGFDTRYRRAAGEDRGLCDSWLTNGYSLRYLPDALVYHAHNLSLRSYWRQHQNYGRGACDFHRLRQGGTVNRSLPRLEPSRFYTGLICHPFHRPRPPRSGSPRVKAPLSPWIISGLLLLSQFATAVGYFSERLQTRGNTDQSNGGGAVAAERNRTRP